MATTYPTEKSAMDIKQEPMIQEPSLDLGKVDQEDREVFKVTNDGVDYRTVTWQRAVIIFIKTQIATGVLGIPSALHALGAVGGGICIVAFQALNCCESAPKPSETFLRWLADKQFIRYYNYCRKLQKQSSRMPQ